MMWTILAFALLAQSSPEQLIATGQYREALAALGRATERSTQWHLQMSKAHDGLGDAANAVREAEAALALEPRSEAAHLQLGQIFLSHHTPEAARAIFTEALTLLPESFLLRLGRGLALKDLSMYDEAEQDLRRCVERSAGMAIAFDALATVYLQTKRFHELQQLAVAQQAANPEDYRGPYFEAAAWNGLGEDRPKIERLLGASLRLNAKFAAAHALLGRVRLQAGEVRSAIGPLETAVSLRPDYAPALLNLAQAYKRAGRAPDAARAFAQLERVNAQERQGKPALEYHRGSR